MAAASVWLVQPPEAQGDDAPARNFSAARALRHLRELARAPHPTGTAENARVRSYLLEQLAALGVAAEEQRAEVVTAPRTPGGPAPSGRVVNVVGRLPGTDNTRALMLAVHYDSVPTAPGASDDGAGVAALLETVRALRTGPPLRNDLVLLFTDGEELGLLGAEAFIASHPLARGVGLALSFEARGAGGPSMMFETSDGNGTLVRALAESAPHPVANSLMYAVYQRLPNDTDLTVYKRAGLPGLNFAYASRLTHYHTMLDSVEEIDARSLQHHGDYALALARRFGGADLRDVRAPDAIYFNALGPAFVRYPASWVWPSTLALVALYAAAILYGLRRARLTWRGMTAGFLTLLLAALAAGLAAWGLWRAARGLHAGFESLPWRTPYDLWAYACGLVLVALSIAWGVYALLFKRAAAADLWAGALAWWVLLLLVSSYVLPLGSFLYAWPLLFALAGFRVALASRAGALVVALAAAPGVALVAPLVYMFCVMLGLEQAGALVVLPVLTAGLAAPLLRGASCGRAWLAPALTLAAGLLFVAAGLAGAGFDERRRKANSLFYLLDADAGHALYVSTDAAPDEWTSRFVGREPRRQALADFFPWSRQQAWAGDAPPAALGAPAVELLEERLDGETRSVRLRIASTRGAPMLLAHTDSATEVRRARVGGRTVVEYARGLRLSYAAPPPEGVEVVLELDARSPLRLVVQDVSYELPAAPRPAHMMPAPSWRTSDTTIVRKTFDLAAGRP